MQVRTIGGARYFTGLLDDASRWSEVCLTATKSDATQAVLAKIEELENQAGKRIKVLRSDRGGEFTSGLLKDYCVSKGIVLETTAPYTPQQNGAAERLNRTLMEKARAMLYDSGLPPRWWGEAVSTANLLRNLTYASGAPLGTPWRSFKRTVPDVSFLRVFGATAYAHVPDKLRKKLDPKSRKGVLVGYEPHSKAYRILLPPARVIVSRDVQFDESVVSVEHPHEPLALAEPPPEPQRLDFGLPPPPEEEATEEENAPVPAAPPASGVAQPIVASADPLSDDEEEDDVPALIEDSDDDEDEIDGGKAPAAAEPRYPVRDRRPPEFYEPVLLASKTVPFKEEPNTHHDALSGPDAPLWRKAMDEELASLLEMDAWKLVPLPPGIKPLPCRWTYKLKRDGDGNIDRYKARLVAKGYAQKEGIDFNEVFAPVSKHSTLRALLSVVAAEDLELIQLDVKLAFLNGELEEDIYMQQPPTYEQGSGMVCHLQRALYGLRQAPRAWNLRFRKELAALGFRQTQSDPSLFVKGSGVDAIYLLVYVDDMLIAARGDLASGVYDAIKKLFTVRNLGDATYFLGMHIARNRAARIIKLSQEQLTLNLLEKFSMSDAKPRRTPIPTGTRLTAEGDRLDTALFPYGALVGSLLYLASCTRPDIAFAANSLARYMAKPTEQHWLVAK
jgi:hypothetical protein